MENENIKVDDKLLKLAAKYNGILITNDVYLKVKCLISQVKTKGYGGTEEYSGILYWDIELDENKYNADLEKLLESKTTMGTNENQYIIVRDLATKEILSIVQNRNGEIKEVIPYEITNGWINKIYPRNPEQRCLFNILQQKDISIVYAGGQFGTGKSFILNNYAIS